MSDNINIVNIIKIKDVREILNKNLEPRRSLHIFEQMQMNSYVESEKGRSDFRAEVEKVLERTLKKHKRKAIRNCRLLVPDYFDSFAKDFRKELNLNLTEKGKRVRE